MQLWSVWWNFFSLERLGEEFSCQVPHLTCGFVWMTTCGKIFTIDNLVGRHSIFVNWCLCKQDGEFVGHLLIHCHVARELWGLIIEMFGMHCVLPGCVRGSFVYLERG